MDTALLDMAKEITAKLTQLQEARRRIGHEGISVLQRLDPETAKLAQDILDDPENIADWFTEEVESLGWRTPWQCIAEGEREEVQRILNAIAHGLPT